MKDVTKKALAVTGVGLICLTLGGLAGANFFPTTVTEYQTIETVKTVTVEKAVPVEVIKEVPVEKLVEVDNGDLAFVTQRLEDKGIFEDAAEVVAELKAEDAALALAIVEIEDNGIDFADDEDIVDEDDTNVVSIKSDYEDVEIVDSDFDNKEYTFKIEAKLNDNGDRSRVIFTVDVEDGEAEIKDIEVI